MSNLGDLMKSKIKKLRGQQPDPSYQMTPEEEEEEQRKKQGRFSKIMERLGYGKEGAPPKASS